MLCIEHRKKPRHHCRVMRLCECRSVTDCVQPEEESSLILYQTTFTSSWSPPVSGLAIQETYVRELLEGKELSSPQIPTFIRSYAGQKGKLSDIKFDRIGSLYPG